MKSSAKLQAVTRATEGLAHSSVASDVDRARDPCPGVSDATTTRASTSPLFRPSTSSSASREGNAQEMISTRSVAGVYDRMSATMGSMCLNSKCSPRFRWVKCWRLDIELQSQSAYSSQSGSRWVTFRKIGCENEYRSSVSIMNPCREMCVGARRSDVNTLRSSRGPNIDIHKASDLTEVHRSRISRICGPERKLPVKSSALTCVSKKSGDLVDWEAVTVRWKRPSTSTFASRYRMGSTLSRSRKDQWTDT